MSGTALAAAWSALAVVFIVFGVTRRPLLAWHGAAYLAFAVVSSGLGNAAVQEFARAVGQSSAGSLHPAPLIVAAACAASALLLIRYGRRAQPALIAAVSGAAVLVSITALAEVIGRFCHDSASTQAAHWCAVASTVFLTAGVVGLARAARRIGVRQLLWAAYVVLAIESGKLLVQDLPSGHMLAIVASLVVYGAMLIQLPRMSRAASCSRLTSRGWSHPPAGSASLAQAASLRPGSSEGCSTAAIQYTAPYAIPP